MFKWKPFCYSCGGMRLSDSSLCGKCWKKMFRPYRIVEVKN